MTITGKSPSSKRGVQCASIFAADLVRLSNSMIWTQSYSIYSSVETCPDEDEFISFLDKDANLVVIRASEIVWMSASTEQLESGRRMVALEDGLPLG